METLENKWQRAADNIKKSQEKQKERHDNQLLDKLVKFRIGNKVLLYHTKVEKQWNGKFDLKWNGLFHIHEILGNRSYKTAHENYLKIYQTQGLTSVELQLGTQIPLIRPEDIP
ncbi:hypothetical protein G9A89_012650 [Geosiphon pyriformis]|nr:hypothetical protein G9A89_012650 [Geosiphon pyriformis]